MSGRTMAATATTVRAMIADAVDALGPGSRPEARWIVAHALGRQPGELVAGLDDVVDPAAADAVQVLVTRRRRGEPLQYVLGAWSFRTLEVHVDRRVLIPRPETEQVVEFALEELSTQARRRAPGAQLVAVDLGAGSGVIALSLAAEAPALDPALQVWATDVSGDALDVLAINLADLARRLPVAARSVHVAEGAWFDALPPRLAGHVALVVSNPPYVSAVEWEALDPEVREHEPVAALVPGPTGVEAIEVILATAPSWLVPGGSVVIELAPAQAPVAAATARRLGYGEVTVRRDLAGRLRGLVARWPREATGA